MKAWTALLALLVLAGPASAAEMEKSKLRQLSKLPHPDGFVLGIGFSSRTGFIFPGEKTEPPAVEIARIRKELNGDVSDAERYLRLGVLFERAECKKDAEDATTRAIALFRQQVKEHPQDMHRLAQLGDALFFKGETKEGETFLRRAVKESPNDWRVWGLLGKCLDSQATWAILGRQYYHFAFSDEQTMHPTVFEKKPEERQIKEWKRFHKEARRCYDRAIKLAPGKTEPRFWRIGSLYIHGVIEAGLRNAQGEQVHMWIGFLKPACIEDTRQIARLSPNDPKIVGGAVVGELLICMAKAQCKFSEPIGVFPEPVPEPSLDFVRWGTHRLEELTKSVDKGIATAASEMLAYALLARTATDGMAIDAHLHLEYSEESDDGNSSAEKTLPKFKEALGCITTGLKMMACLGQIEGNLRRVIKLDPTRELAWDALTAILCESGRTAEAIALCEQRIKIKDTTHNRYCLAYGYAEQRKYNEAIKQLRAGLKCEENDLSCRLGLIAVWLQRSNADDLIQAGEQLDSLKSPIKRAKRKGQLAQYKLLRGLHTALRDQPEQAKDELENALQEDMDDRNRTAVQALASLGLPATSADEPLALEYLRIPNDDIQRAGKQPDSPVVKIRLAEDNYADEDLYFLSAFPHLCGLQIRGHSITDAGLVHLGRLSMLRYLDLHSPGITDAGLMHLHKLEHLESVNLRGTGVSDKGIAELRKVLPRLEISR